MIHDLARRFRLTAIILSAVLATMIHAQIQLVPNTSVHVYRNDTLLVNAFCGGWNSPQFSEIDLNNDGYQDLAVFDRDYFGQFQTFLYDLACSCYRFAPEYLHIFPQCSNWVLLRDYDCDGFEDLFTSVPGGIKVYHNDYLNAGHHSFSLQEPVLKAEGLNGLEPVYVSPPDLPAINDVDGDGDLDILSFEVLGNFVTYFKNMSVETAGDCSLLKFEVKNMCWGFFSEDAINNTLILYDTCDVNVNNPEKGNRHAGSSLLVIDPDANGISDLLIGDISYNTLTLAQNGGTTTSSIMTGVVYNYPIETTPVNITVFPAAYTVDVDHDQKQDLLVAPNNPNTSENHRQVWYYRNEANSLGAEYQLVSSEFLAEMMIDVGEGAHALFFDANGDGLFDIVTGNRGYFESAGVYKSRLMLLQNNGTISEPRFELNDEDFAGLSVYEFSGIYPVFADMDGDGDRDMLTGDDEGMIHYFRNDAGPGQPAEFILTAPNFMGIDAGQSAKPAVADLDEDGLNDLLVGERSGKVLYFYNEGTSDNPIFSSQPTSDFFGKIDVMPECCTGYSTPWPVKDSAGNWHLYVGSEQGWLYRYDGVTTEPDAEFLKADSLYMYANRINISAADINNDGKNEWISGQYTGGIRLWKEGKPWGLGVQSITAGIRSFRIWPNPATDEIRVSWSPVKKGSPATIEIYSITGSLMFSQRIDNPKETNLIASPALPAGAYIIRVVQDQLSRSGRLILTR